MADAVESGEGADALGAGIVGLTTGRGALGDDQEVFRGVLGGDEFKDFGFVAGPFEELSAEGVGDEFGLAFLKDAVAQGIGENRWCDELGANFFLAAGGNDEQTGAGGDALSECVVGGGVASVECDQDVAGGDGGFVDGARYKREVIAELVRGGRAVAEFDELGARFDAGDVGAGREERGEGKGEVAFARTHIDNLDRLARCGGVVERKAFGQVVR